MKPILLLALLLVACHPAPSPKIDRAELLVRELLAAHGKQASISWPDGTSIYPYTDVSLCSTRTDTAAVPQYDGDVWRLGASTEGVRCGVEVQEQDYVMGWLVMGQHTAAGTATTRACLQRMETSMVPGATQHVDVEHGGASSCMESAASEAGAFLLYGLLYSEPWHRAVDNTYSIWVRGNGQPGDIFGAAVPIVVRPL